jgi:hypothetical protein
MKKQTILILVSAVVIASLLSVSAINNRYSISPCDAIDISLENTTVATFLDETNMTTVQVFNYKGYEGKNTWMVQWSSSDRLINVYVDIATGDVVGIEEMEIPIPTPAPTPTPSPSPSWHTVTTLWGDADRTSQYFPIRGDAWRIKYKVTPDSGAVESNFSLMVFDDYWWPNWICTVTCHDRACDNVKYLYEGKGNFYIDVTSSGNWWELEVEDYY